MSTAEELLDIHLLQRLLRYEPETGKLFWLERPANLFDDKRQSSQSITNRWNARFAGSEAFSSENVQGYKKGEIFKKFYLAHRVIWALVHNGWPIEDIDHINGDRADNRLKNLRSVTRQENTRNQKRRNTNTSGVMGVSFDNECRKWRVYIRVEGRRLNLGRFEALDAATAARKEAEVRYGYHENHGRAA